jgi:hypothetical protein
MLKLLLLVQCTLILAQVMAISICFILSMEMEKSLFSGGYGAYITFPIGLVICYPRTTFKYNSWAKIQVLLCAEYLPHMVLSISFFTPFCACLFSVVYMSSGLVTEICLPSSLIQDHIPYA